MELTFDLIKIYERRHQIILRVVLIFITYSFLGNMCRAGIVIRLPDSLHFATITTVAAKNSNGSPTSKMVFTTLSLQLLFFHWYFH